MKSMIRISILALSLLSLFVPLSSSARAGGSSAEGSLNFLSQDGFKKHLEFSAVTDGGGNATGKMTFSGAEELPAQDVDGTGRAGFSGKVEDLFVEAEFDQMVVEGNKAMLSGRVTACNVGEYIGQRVLLVVEDNGAGGGEKADKLSWAFSKPAERGWTPTDAELEKDEGVLLSWVATDAEREDDKGVPMPNVEVGQQSFPLSSHDFADVTYLDGDIRVRQ
ncbi:MAG TPA: hypothetical protein VFS10_15930 [Pyrinomonadaceae bacterium]|nr:hypothetical protein [Pyrinomonadaceae bacterium]